MAVIVAEQDVKDVTEALENTGETVFRIGQVMAGERGCTVRGGAGCWSGRSAWTATHHG
jgi:phosphoribosylformylglycinamidine cyclo-ligase